MFFNFYREDPVISSVIMSVKVTVAVLDSPEPAFNPAVFEDNLLIFHKLAFKKSVNTLQPFILLISYFDRLNLKKCSFKTSVLH